MNKYEVELTCNEPVGNGFTCAAEDSLVFDFSGDLLSSKKIQTMVNDTNTVLKRCSKCFAQNWLVKSFSPLVYQKKQTQWHR